MPEERRGVDVVPDLLRERPTFHVDGDGNPIAWAPTQTLLDYVNDSVKPGMHTIETGCGWTTAAFIARGAHHTSVTPAGDEHDRVRTWCEGKGVDASRFTPIAEASQDALPRLDPPAPLDFVLIDGDHAYPAPAIDWYYSARHLRRGGTMLVDDRQLWAVRDLFIFLEADDLHEPIAEGSNWRAYRTKADGHEIVARWWGQQPVATLKARRREQFRFDLVDAKHLANGALAKAKRTLGRKG
jgi:hypothetical protein